MKGSGQATIQKALARLSDEEIKAIDADWQLWARDDQLPPVATPDGMQWSVWLVLGGRGAGKTRAGAEWIKAQALGLSPFAKKPAGRIALVGETMADVRSVMVEGVSGLLAVHRPEERPLFEPSKMQLTWPNGTIAQMFSAENSESLRGPQFAIAWCDEIAKWRNGEETWDMLQFARPYPAFPYNLDVWGDGENWRLGHWLNGRLSGVPLADLVAAMLDDFDFTQADTQGLAGTVPGYVVDRPMTARDALQPLGLAYFFDAIESGAQIAFRHRGAEPHVVSLTRDELVETKPEAPLLTLTRAQETDLPASAKISYIGGSSSYAQAVAEARRLVGASGRLAKAELPIVMEADQAAGISESWLFESWASRERARCELPPSLLELEPGDVINLESGEGSRPYRITEVGDAGARRLEALSIDPDVYHFANTPTRETNTGTTVVNGAPRLVFLDLPLLTGNEPPASGYVAAVQDPWPGVVAVYGSPEASGFRLRGLLPAPAVMGVTTTTVPSGASSRIDYATRLQVELGGGELSSVTRTQLLAGANVAAIRGANGVWEVIQFETAELLYENAYELTGLLRGQAGSELAIADEGSPIAAGADFVLLDGAVTSIDLSLDELRLPYTWRYGRAADDLAGASFDETQHAFGGIGLRPYAPVHLSGARALSGDLEINWIRRTRIGGDNWEISEPPVSEDYERYEVDVLATDQSVVRTLTSETPSVTYTTANQIADFGAPQAELNVQVFQVSAQYGRGAPAQAAV